MRGYEERLLRFLVNVLRLPTEGTDPRAALKSFAREIPGFADHVASMLLHNPRALSEVLGVDGYAELDRLLPRVMEGMGLSPQVPRRLVVETAINALASDEDLLGSLAGFVKKQLGAEMGEDDLVSAMEWVGRRWFSKGYSRVVVCGSPPTLCLDPGFSARQLVEYAIAHAMGLDNELSRYKPLHPVAALLRISRDCEGLRPAKTRLLDPVFSAGIDSVNSLADALLSAARKRVSTGSYSAADEVPSFVDNAASIVASLASELGRVWGDRLRDLVSRLRRLSRSLELVARSGCSSREAVDRMARDLEDLCNYLGVDSPPRPSAWCFSTVAEYLGEGLKRVAQGLESFVPGGRVLRDGSEEAEELGKLIASLLESGKMYPGDVEGILIVGSRNRVVADLGTGCRAVVEGSGDELRAAIRCNDPDVLFAVASLARLGGMKMELGDGWVSVVGHRDDVLRIVASLPSLGRRIAMESARMGSEPPWSVVDSVVSAAWRRLVADRLRGYDPRAVVDRVIRLFVKRALSNLLGSGARSAVSP